MAATGKTPILLYGSTTPTNVPVAGNLTNSSDGCEIAINVADKNLFFKDSTNTVNTVPIRQSSSGSNGWLSSTDWSTFNGKQAALISGTNIKTVSGNSLLGSGDVGTIGTGYGGTGLTSFYGNGVLYASSASSLTTGVALQFDGSHIFSLGSGGTAATVDGIKLYGTNNAGGGTFVQGFRDGAASYIFGDTAATLGSGTGYITYVYGANPTTWWNNGSQTMQLASNGNLTLNTGNLVIGTSGKGIDFSATPGTGTSELLADYEEGTWTPTISSSSGSVSSYTSSGTYQKIGSFVSIQFYIVVSNVGTASGGFYVSLPYTSAVRACGAIRENVNTGYMFQAWISAAGATTFSINRYDNVNGWNPGNGMAYFGCLTYQV